MYQPSILGVLNISRDSTTRVSVAETEEQILERAAALSRAGAAYIDVGARSTWEFAEIISDEREQEELVPVVQLLKQGGYRVSADTWSPTTAMAVVQAGADMLNYTGRDLPSEMLAAVAEQGASLVVTYMPYDDPYVMRTAPRIRPTISRLQEYFASALAVVRRYEVGDVILDPNIGIVHHSYQGNEKLWVQAAVIAHLNDLNDLGCPLLIHSPRSDDANARAIMGSFVLQQRPAYVRTHFPELMFELLGYDAEAVGC